MDSKRLVSFISIFLLIFSLFTSSKSQTTFPPANSPIQPPTGSSKPPPSPSSDGPVQSPIQTPARPSSPLPSPSLGSPVKSPNPSPPQSEGNSPIQSPTALPQPPSSPSFGAPVESPKPSPSPVEKSIPGGKWEVLQRSVGVSAMHMQLVYNNKVVIFDSTNFGASNLSLPNNKKCQQMDNYSNSRKHHHKLDCTAHSFLYDVVANTYRPLVLHSNVWASSGANDNDGVLVQSGGYRLGSKKIRVFRPANDDRCDWQEVNQMLRMSRYYATTQSLPDDRIIIVGGHATFTYEFFPKAAISPEGDAYSLPFLKSTFDHVEVANLYPFVHLLPDGNLFIFAGRQSILLNYLKHRVVKKFPRMPGAKRSNPLTGSSVLLPLNLTGIKSNDRKSLRSLEAEVMICGGAFPGAYVKASKGEHMLAAKSCGRLKVMDKEPKWAMEKMPLRRVMPDMLLLPTGDLIIVNGAGKGSAMWEMAEDPVLHPVLYVTCEPDPSKRFLVMNPTSTPRLFQSSAVLLPDGRILVGGSNPTGAYKYSGLKYPTDTSLEAFSPHYLDPRYDDRRPLISSLDGAPQNVISYGREFSMKFGLKYYNPGQEFTVTLIAPSFTTHSFAMNQRLMVLECAGAEEVTDGVYNMKVYAPPTKNIAPPGYYMMFVVHDGIPSPGVWVKLR